ncbi:MAG: VCBS repeat-containing protein [Planctomycetales bacterium]|nr:VCBS repeat-containing protein [Planctomycetales bacterium]
MRLVIPVHRHPDTQQDGGTHSIYVLSAATGRIEHQADDLAFPQLVDWNNDGLDDLAVFVPDDAQRFEQRHVYPDKPSGKFVVLRGSPPEAFRRLDRWVEEQDFDGDGIAELSQPMGGMGVDYAVQIASGRDGLIQSRWKTEWPETPRTRTVGEIRSFPAPLGDFDGDGLADLLLTRDPHFHDFDAKAIVQTGRVPLLMQAISGKSGKRVWGGPSLPLPEDLRPTSADENTEPWLSMRLSQIRPTITQAVDVDGDGRPELLQTLGLFGYRLPKSGGDRPAEHQQQYVALIDGRDGALRWAEPLTEFVQGNSWWYSAEQFQLDAAHDLDADGTRDVVIVIPHRDEQGWWSGTLQARNGRDGKLLWPAQEIDGKWIDSRGIKSPRIGDLDGDGRPEIVLYETIQPQLRTLRGDTGETLWSWKATQNLSQMTPDVVLIGRRLGTPARPDAEPNPEDKDRTGKSAHPTGDGVQRGVAVTINETGNQWELVLLEHAGQVVERGTYQSNQLWSRDLDGDGGEELLRYVDNKLTATRGLHDVLWTWSPPPFGYVHVSRFDRTADGRAIVVTSSGDSLTLLDGPTGKPLGRTFKSTNTMLNENGRLVDLNHANIAKRFENSRLVSRVGDGHPMLDHVVSRAVLPTDEDGRYQRSRHAPRDEPNASPASNAGSTSIKDSTSTARSAHHAERDGYVRDDDPRLVRQLMWAPTPAEWVATRAGIFKDVLLAMTLSLIVVLIPYWLIRAGMRRRDSGRWRAALIGCGIILFGGSLTLLRFAPPGARWRDVPWALPFAMAIGGLPILMFPAALFRALASGEWRRVRWLLGSTLILTLVLTVLHFAVDLPRKPPEQHYSWFGWWWIIVTGAYFTGACLVAWRGFGPCVRWLWNVARRKLARHG